MTRKAGLTIIKLLVSTGLLVLLYRKTPLEGLLALLADIDWRYLLPIALLLFVNTVLSAWKWKILLRRDQVEIPLPTLIATYLIGSFYNLFLPSNIGGDSYRIYDIARKSRQTMRSAVSVLADRFSGFLALVTLGLVSSVFVALRLHHWAFFLGPLLIFLALVALLAVLHCQTPVRRFLAVTRLDRFPALARLADRFFLSWQKFSDPGLLLQVMLISFAFQFSVICVVYLLALSLHARVPFFYFAAFVPLITLMEALPISIYGIGIRDAGYVFFFGQAGLSDLQTRSLALLFLGLTVCYSLVGGLIHLWRALGPDERHSRPGQSEVDAP
ncbi:MAG TPA: flippase-like domain-containing protein [Desulfobulbus sp.]|nr:flippase-like domain-containing protein [Desulfobulbus sp.]